MRGEAGCAGEAGRALPARKLQITLGERRVEAQEARDQGKSGKNAKITSAKGSGGAAHPASAVSGGPSGNPGARMRTAGRRADRGGRCERRRQRPRGFGFRPQEAGRRPAGEVGVGAGAAGEREAAGRWALTPPVPVRCGPHFFVRCRPDARSAPGADSRNPPPGAADAPPFCSPRGADPHPVSLSPRRGAPPPRPAQCGRPSLRPPVPPCGLGWRQSFCFLCPAPRGASPHFAFLLRGPCPCPSPVSSSQTASPPFPPGVPANISWRCLPSVNPASRASPPPPSRGP